jgi:hypothetical protein
MNRPLTLRADGKSLIAGNANFVAAEVGPLQRTENKVVEFNAARMRALVAKDAAMKFFFDNMIKNKVGYVGDVAPSEEKLLEVLFNGEVLEDTCMQRKYAKLKVAA